MRILLVEDDSVLGQGVQTGLQVAGFVVDWLNDGVQAGLALEVESFDAIVLDWGLPRQNGLSVLQQMRARGDKTPVLMLTARDSVDDRIQGLDAGADDYLLKPFALGEVVARLRALIRRASGEPTACYRMGALVFDTVNRSARLKGENLPLSAKELAILELLLRQSGRPLSREQIESALYGWGMEVESNAVEVHIHHLRKKLGDGWIKTLRGIGYLLTTPKGGADVSA